MKYVITLSLLLVSLTTYTQNKTPIWAFPSCGNTIHGIAVGLADIKDSCITNVNGIRLEAIGLGLGIGFLGFRPSSDINDSIIMNQPATGTINGINLSLFGTINPDNLNGLTIGGFAQALNDVNGVMISLAGNISTEFSGLQLSFMGNDAYSVKGVQLCFASNSTNILNGVQIALFNRSQKTKGIQIGLWNVNEKRKLPIINWCFRSSSK